MFFTLIVTAVLAPALLACASPANLTKRAASLAEVITKCTVPNTAALTFDDGPYQYIQVRTAIFVLILIFCRRLLVFRTYQTP